MKLMWSTGTRLLEGRGGEDKEKRREPSLKLCYSGRNGNRPGSRARHLLL